jgi:hypothetical protein
MVMPLEQEINKIERIIITAERVNFFMMVVVYRLKMGINLRGKALNRKHVSLA